MDSVVVVSGIEFFELGKDLAGAGVSLRFQVRGESMWPFIRDGDIVEVVPASAAQLSVGDVVLCRSGTRLLVHRVIRCTHDESQVLRFVTRGDSLRYAEPPHDESLLVGRVAALQRGRRRIALDQGFYAALPRLLVRGSLILALLASLRRAGRGLFAMACKIRGMAASRSPNA
ncbi:MAG: S24/S26 family peptidase [Anaerolineae bacterium]|nr:S24/S26 family peptidase [Anaerolineae bacterium]